MRSDNGNKIWLVYGSDFGEPSVVLSAWSSKRAAQRAAAIIKRGIDDGDVSVQEVQLDGGILPGKMYFMAILHSVKRGACVNKSDVDICLTDKGFFGDAGRRMSRITEGWEPDSVNIYEVSSISPEEAIDKCIDTARRWQKEKCNAEK